jgi:glycosyltransferase involved in cell wall biosynthesis
MISMAENIIEEDEFAEKKVKLIISLTSETTLRAFYMNFIIFLKGSGWEVEIITSENRNLQEVASTLGVKIHDVHMKRQPSPKADFRSFLAIFKILRSAKPDLVVAATPKASLLTISASSLLGIRARIYQIWGLRFESTRGFQRSILKQLERLTATLATAVTANSRSLANQVSLNNISKKVTVIGSGSSHGVDTKYFSPKQSVISQLSDFNAHLENNHHCFTIIFVGRLNRDKGVDTLLEAHSIALKNNRIFRLLLIGEVEDPELAKKVDELSGTYLHRFGHKDDVRPYLSVSDALCLPTLREGFPNVVIEAAAMGLPAIVSDATGSIDSVENTKTGLIFPVGNAPLLEEAIQFLASNTEVTKLMGTAARQKAEQLYSQDVLFPLIESFFRKQLSN